MVNLDKENPEQNPRKKRYIMDIEEVDDYPETPINWWVFITILIAVALISWLSYDCNCNIEKKEVVQPVKSECGC